MMVTGFENAAAAWLAAWVESGIRILLFAALVGGALAVFRVRRAAWRLGAWTIVLWAALAMPALGRVMPAWRVQVPVLPSAVPNEDPDSSDLGVQVPLSSSMTSNVEAKDPKPQQGALGAPPITQSPTASRASSTTLSITVPTATDTASARLSSSGPTTPPTPSAKAAALSLTKILIGVYLIGLIALTFRAGLGWLAAQRLERAVRPIDDASAVAQLGRIASTAGLRRSPRLGQCSQLFVPVTMSVVRPIVVLPDSWDTWDGATLEAVLTHEAAHIARRDGLTQRLSLLYRAICWFNPLAWWLVHRLVELAEQASDEAVLSAGTSHTQYARMLLEFFRAIPPPGHRADWHVAMARGSASNAERRVEQILAWKSGQATLRLTRSVVLSAALAATLGVALAASVRPVPMTPGRTASAAGLPTAQSAQGAPGAPASAASTPAISGTVKDGVTGRPLSGVVVSLRPPVGSVTGPLIRITRQLTDERGRFVFRDLLAADGYSIRTARVGYVDADYGQTAMLGPSGRIALKDGQWFAEADILMWKPGAISGRVIDEFNEPMVGVYVRALARQLVAGRLQFIAAPVALTDDRGEYRIANLIPGAYLVQVPSVQTTVPIDMAPSTFRAADDSIRLLMPEAAKLPRMDASLDPVGPSRQVIGNYATPPPGPDGRGQAYPITYYPSGSSHTTAQSIDIGLGEERHGVVIAVHPAPTARIFGTAQGPPAALAGLVLRLMPAGLEDLPNGEEAATALVAADGRFAFLNVTAGSYVIDAPRTPLELTFQAGSGTTVLPQAPGLGPNGSQSGSIASAAPGTGYIRRSGRGDDLYWAKTPVTIGATDIPNLVVVLNKSLTLSGRLVYEGTTRVTIESVPIARGGGRASAPAPTTETTMTTPKPDHTPTIYCEPADGSPSLGLPRSVPLPDGNGTAADSFRIEGLKGGEYVIRVPSGLERYTIKSITVGGSDYTNKPIDSLLLDGRGEIVMTLTDKVISVNGVVSNDQGPTGDAAVLAFPVERDQWTRYGFTPLRIKAAPVASKSGYGIKGLPAGTYYVIAVDKSLVTAWQDPKFLERAAAVATRVTLAWDDTKTVDLKVVHVK